MVRWISGPVGAALLSLSSAAYADDDDWSGIYVGAEAGAASGRLRASGTDFAPQLSNIFVPGRGIVVIPSTALPSDGSKTETKLIYGGLVGGQWQTGRVILGLEADFHGARDFAGYTNSVTLPITILSPGSNGTISRSARMSYDWSVRARLGTAVGAHSMVYVSGGLAGTRVRLTGVDSFITPAGAGPGPPTFVSPTIGPVVLTSTERRSFKGWTAGAGGEVKLSRHIGIGLDGRYTDFGSHTFALASRCAGGSGSAVAGTCPGTSRSAPPIVINGTTLNPAVDVTPAIVPSTTRASFRDLRLTARVVLHF